MKEIMRLEVFRGLITMFSELPSVNTGGAGRLWEVRTQNFQQAHQFFPPAASAHTSLMSLPSRPLNRCTQALDSPRGHSLSISESNCFSKGRLALNCVQMSENSRILALGRVRNYLAVAIKTSFPPAPEHRSQKGGSLAATGPGLPG